MPVRNGSCVLLSPLGLSPGLLFSAIVHLQPDLVIVICSEQAALSLSEIQKQSGYQGKLFCIKVEDPFLCFQARDEVILEVRSLLSELSIDDIIVNLTGGTTALQYLVQNTGLELKSEGYDCTEMAFIDRREYTVQRENPFVLGEMIVLSGKNI